MLELRSLRTRLIAIVVAVVGTAMGIVFLYVVPSLHDNLVEARIRRLDSAARSVLAGGEPRAALVRRDFEGAAPSLVRIARNAGANLSVFAIAGDLVLPIETRRPANVADDHPILAQARESARPVSLEDDERVLVATAVPNGVVVFAQSATDVAATAEVVQQQILIAAALALAVATLVGWVAALSLTRRVRRLELAARRISGGQFDEPIADPSPDELGQLARSFDLMQDRLAQMDRARKDFIANASHELRTPLFSLGGFLELLAEEDLDEETREEFMRTMRDQVNRLAKLATDLLDLSRLDAGAVAIRREPLELAATARALVREFRGLAARRGSRVRLRIAADVPSGIGDEERVQQIGRALVDNAVRHNPPGTEVTVSVTAAAGRVALEVADDGPGIDQAVRDSLFERFSRGTGATSSGSGLGLAIAYELAERMGGGLSVETGDGCTRFTLALPAAAPARAAAAVP
jgi:signal transduction histidine kinase